LDSIFNKIKYNPPVGLAKNGKEFEAEKAKEKLGREEERSVAPLFRFA
jgi:hypothetical protein